MDNGSAITAILLWLSPIITSVLWLALILVVMPLVAGAVTAVVVLVRRVIVGPPPSSSGRNADPEAEPTPDPWAQLTALSETPAARGGDG